MEYGININSLRRELSLAQAAELVARAGFTQLDYTPPLREDTWEASMKEAAAIFADNGLAVHQTHAPFNRYGRFGDRHRLYVDRCAEATEFLGAKYLVVHGDEFDFENLTFTPETALEYNHDYFLPYVERAQKNGYKVAFETVFEDVRPQRRFTSKADELLDLILSFESGSAVCCWDFGHAHVAFQDDAAEQIRRFGKLIQCTHLHDNFGVDTHQMPMTGSINWKAVMDAFREIGYSGVTSIEYSSSRLPGYLLEDFITLTYKITKHLWTL